MRAKRVAPFVVLAVAVVMAGLFVVLLGSDPPGLFDEEEDQMIALWAALSTPEREKVARKGRGVSTGAIGDAGVTVSAAWSYARSWIVTTPGQGRRSGRKQFGAWTSVAPWRRRARGRPTCSQRTSGPRVRPATGTTLSPSATASEWT